jgi:manganese oxidase
MTKNVTRRDVLSAAAIASGALVFGGAARTFGEQCRVEDSLNADCSTVAPPRASPSSLGNDFVRVTVPNGSTLDWTLIDGVKVFHLVAEPVRREFAPGLVVDCWGYNGETPGPLIEAVEGDRVRFYVTNRLNEPTSVHWHGLFLPNGMDGVSGLNQAPIGPGETFKYEFTLRQSGTFMYHPHFDEMTQMGMGMMGMFVIHPREQKGARIDRDFAIMLSEWFIKPGTSKPDPSVMSDFNILTMNSKAFPGTTPLVAKVGDRVRIRFGNLSAMDHHPIHLHGYSFKLVATDGGRIPEAAQWPETTVLVPVGSTREIEFVADAPGDWAMHCHMTHHVMNQMGHEIPNMLGVDTRGLDQKVQKLLPDYMTMGEKGMGDMGVMAESMGVPRNSIPMLGARGKHGHIDMGGMFTILKVREKISNYGDPGWYENPEGTVASAATSEDLRRDRIVS